MIVSIFSFQFNLNFLDFLVFTNFCSLMVKNIYLNYISKNKNRRIHSDNENVNELDWTNKYPAFRSTQSINFI